MIELQYVCFITLECMSDTAQYCKSCVLHKLIRICFVAVVNN